MRTLLVCFGLLLVVFASAVTALYGPKDGVILANEANFQSIVLQSNLPSMVEFFAPWCGHCKNLAPEYKKVAAAVKGMVNIVAVDCDNAASRSLCGMYDVKGFPTLKLFTPGKKSADDYQGARSAKAIADAVLAKLDSKNIKGITAKNADDFFADQALPKVILFTDKSKPSKPYMALSMEYKGRLAFAVVSNKEAAFVDKYGIDTFPTLIVIKNDEGQTVSKYDGDLGFQDLNKFLSTFAPKATKGGPKSKASHSEDDEAASTPVPLEQKLYALESEADYTKYCVEQRRICAIAFVPPKDIEEDDHARALTALEELVKARAPGDAFLIMWTEGSTNSFRRTLDLAMDLPTFAAVNPKKKGYVPFRGAFTAKAMGEFLDSVKTGAKRTIPLSDFPTALFDKQ